MRKYLKRRFLWMIPTLLLLSIVCFVVIELPPGDYATTYIQQLELRGEQVDPDMLMMLRKRYGLDKSPVERYFTWVWGLIRGDFGYSFYYRQEVGAVLLPRMGYTVGLSLSSMLITYAIALPLGIYSAIRHNKMGDYAVSMMSYLGMSVPTFIFGLFMLYVNARFFGNSVGGLFSREFQDAAWSWAKFVDLMKHAWIPIVIIAVSGTAGTIRSVRANMLDELKKPYVELARAKGLSESRLLLKYPFRIAVNPIISGLAGVLSSLVGGETILSMVLSIPTVGPVFLSALRNQDMYLAGDYIMLTGILVVIGTVLSDILLAISDPRIRYE